VERQERAVIFAGAGRAVSGSFVYGVAVFKKQARWLVASGGVGSNDLGASSCGGKKTLPEGVKAWFLTNRGESGIYI
jgi:hypothetical protein